MYNDYNTNVLLTGRLWGTNEYAQKSKWFTENVQGLAYSYVKHGTQSLAPNSTVCLKLFDSKIHMVPLYQVTFHNNFKKEVNGSLIDISMANHLGVF
jgi:hypothetical protein